METALKVLGAILIIVGIVTGSVVYDRDLAEQYKEYKASSSLYEEELEVLKPLQSENVANAWTLIGAGVISGMFFFALGYILDELMKGNEQREKLINLLNKNERLLKDNEGA
jgi:hypothetical protein